MRLAVCISGQVRNSATTLPALAKFIRGIGAEVFVSTWKQPGTKVSGFQGAWHVQRMFGPVFSQFLPRHMMGSGVPKAAPHFEAAVTREVTRLSQPVTQEQLTGLFAGARVDIEEAGAMDFRFPTTSSDNNSLRMLYKIWRANEMKRLRERQTGIRFDAVLRLRPDIVPRPISPDMLQEMAASSNKTVYVDDILPKILGDKFALSSSEQADYYASLFGKALCAPGRPWRGIHHELHDHLGEAGLEPPLHRVEGHAASDAEQQAINRRILLEQFASRQLEPWLFASADEAEYTEKVLRAADLLEAGDVAGAGNIVFPLLDNPAAPPAILADVLGIAGEISVLRGEAGDGYTAVLLSWALRAQNGKLEDLAFDQHLAATLRTMSQAVDSTRKVSAFSWSAAEPMLGLRRESGAWARLATDALDGVLQSHAVAALDFLRARYMGSPDYLEALVAEATHLLHGAKDPEGAAEIARTIVAMAPASWRGHDLLGHCSERLGDPEAALHHAQAALACNPSQGGLQSRVGCVLMYLLDQPAEAEPYLRRGASLWSDARALHWHAEALARLDRVPEARAAIEEAVQRAPANPDYQALKERLLRTAPPAA